MQTTSIKIIDEHGVEHEQVIPLIKIEDRGEENMNKKPFKAKKYLDPSQKAKLNLKNKICTVIIGMGNSSIIFDEAKIISKELDDSGCSLVTKQGIVWVFEYAAIGYAILRKSTPEDDLLFKRKEDSEKVVTSEDVLKEVILERRAVE
jgi:hypothetical protein